MRTLHFSFELRSLIGKVAFLGTHFHGEPKPWRIERIWPRLDNQDSLIRTIEMVRTPDSIHCPRTVRRVEIDLADIRTCVVKDVIVIGFNKVELRITIPDAISEKKPRRQSRIVTKTF